MRPIRGAYLATVGPPSDDGGRACPASRRAAAPAFRLALRGPTRMLPAVSFPRFDRFLGKLPAGVLPWALAVAVAAGAGAAEGTWTAEGAHRWQALSVPPGERAGFVLLPPRATGLDFTNAIAGARHLANQQLLDGSGVTAADIDGDGRVDVFFAGLGGASGLWRNLGDWHFANVTAAAFGTGGPLATLDATGCAFADLDGDGSPDLVVNSHGQGTHVFLNDGHGRFHPRPPVLNAGRGGRTVAIGDVDGDGWPDLYIANSRVRTMADQPNARPTFRTERGRAEVVAIDGRPATAPDLTNRFVVNARGGVDELGEPDVLYRNLGGTNLAEVPWTGGAFLDADGAALRSAPLDWGLAAMFRDLDGDGRPDLYVANDFEGADRIWWNESRPGEIRFRAGPRRGLRHTSLSSMGVDMADVDRDGHDDVLVVDMLGRDHRQRLTQREGRPAPETDPSDPDAVPQQEANVLQMGRGDRTFAETAAFAGVQASDWSWTPAFLDVDLDGWEDLLVTTGQWRSPRDLDVAAEVRRMRQTRRMTDAELFAMRLKLPRLDTPNVAFRNDGHGRFVEAGQDWGFDTPGVKHGMCLADLDGDGDADVLVNQLNGPALVYRNEATAPRVAIRLRGDGGNRRGIGARIRVTPRDGPLPVQTQEITAGGRYLSGDDAERTFAARGTESLSIRVRWPDGRESVVSDGRPNRRYELSPGPAAPAPARVVAPPAWFVDDTARIGHTNRAVPFDEFLRQPLAPRRLLNEGPGVSWGDVDGDGKEDLVVGAGFHGTLAVFVSDGTGGFRRGTNLAPRAAHTTVLPFGGKWAVGESSHADGTPVGAAISTWPGGGPSWPAGADAVGALAAADVDGDGVLELFAGGRVVSGQWPAAATSWLLKEDGGVFGAAQTFTNLGLVQGAVFADFDADGKPDLALACEWGPPRLFRNQRGRLAGWEPEIAVGGSRQPLSALSGLWTSVQAGDLDGDGRMDLVLGNWGENSFAALYGTPRVAFHGDLDQDGYHDVILAYPRPGRIDAGNPPAPEDLLPVHGLSVLGPLVPALRERFATHRAFANADLAGVLGEEGAGMKRVEARWMASVVLLNRGDHFELRRLPDVVQRAPVWGIVVADFDGDGHEDVFVAQNYSGHNHGWPRDDAGLGVVLRGRGDGGFDALDPAASGVRIDGEGRGAATADYDGDGRPDLAVAESGGPLRLFRNATGKPGLRVRLQGPAGNPTAAGASVRLGWEGQAGPARESRLGGGHWSCDAATLVMARPVGGPTELRVRWPGGAETTTQVGATAREVVIGADGAVVRSR